MGANNPENKLIVSGITRALVLHGIQHVIDEKRTMASSNPALATNSLKQDIEELDKIIEFIGNKKFSIVLA